MSSSAEAFESLKMSGISDALRTEALGQVGLHGYLEMLNGAFEGVPIHTVLSLMAASSEPADPATGRVIDHEREISLAFQQGGLVGIRSVDLLLGTDVVLDVHEGIAVKRPQLTGISPDERFVRLEKWRDSIQAAGNAGVELAEGMEDLIDEWGPRAVSDYKNVGYFRRGFGLVIFAACRWQARNAPRIEAVTSPLPKGDDMWTFFNNQFDE